MSAVAVAVGSAAIAGATGFTVTLTAVGGGAYHPLEDDLILAFPSSQSTVVSVSDAAMAPWVNCMGDAAELNHTGSACGLMAVRYRVTSTDEGNDEDTYSATVFGTETGAVLVVAVRGADWTSGNPIDNFGINETASVTPHVLAAITGTGGLLVDDSLVISTVTKDATGAYSSTPAGWDQLVALSTNQGRWLGNRQTNTTANTNVSATNITPSAADESLSISIAVLSAAGGATDLVVADATVAVSVDVPTLTQVHQLTVADATVAVAIDVPTLTQVHLLTVADATVTVAIESPTLTQVHQLAVADATVAVSIDTVTLTQVHELVVADLTVPTAIEPITLSVGGIDLVVEDLTVDVAAEAPTVTQVHQLAVADVTVAVQADTVALTQVHALAASDVTVGTTIDTVVLIVGPLAPIVAPLERTARIPAERRVVTITAENRTAAVVSERRTIPIPGG